MLIVILFSQSANYGTIYDDGYGISCDIGCDADCGAGYNTS